MPRLLCVVLALAMAGCAQHETPFTPNGLPTTPNAGAAKAKPNEVVAHVTFKYEQKQPIRANSEFTIYTSYNNEPWFVYSRECVKPGDTVSRDVYYREPNKVQQIKFSAERAVDEVLKCGVLRTGHRTLAWHSLYFENGRTHFHVTYDVVNHKVNGKDHATFTLCAEGTGRNKRCDDKGD